MKRFKGCLAARSRIPRRARELIASSLVAGPVLAGTWLFMAALPALADGGPHVAAMNSGASTLTADSCAGCHRAHTAQGPQLLAASDADALCLTCHGPIGTGATTDVMSGVQYRAPLAAAAGTGVRTGPLLGALRSGGFEQARIDSGNPARVLQSGSADNSWGRVGVGASQDVTSAHLNLAQNGLTAPAVAWGNGADGSGPGPVVQMSCTSCHNPHGNGNYRILNPVPAPDATAGTFTPVTTPGAQVSDAALPAAGDSRNYTVIQVKGPSYLLYASQVATAGNPDTAGDYWHVRVPWNRSDGTYDAPNGIPSGTTKSFNYQITAWCTACHSRYYSFSAHDDSTDPDFRYRHQTTTGDLACTTCHVAHGSNARMAGTFSAAQPFPNAATPRYTIPTSGDPIGTTGDSRLLKIDNRGTCQMCHDPTRTSPFGIYQGPLPQPGAP